MKRFFKMWGLFLITILVSYPIFLAIISLVKFVASLFVIKWVGILVGTILLMSILSIIPAAIITYIES
jgi:hypothetical protein